VQSVRKSTDVSKEHIASIFRLEEYANIESNVKAGGKQKKERNHLEDQGVDEKIILKSKLYLCLKNTFNQECITGSGY
jgi:hypothetical protein